MGKLSSVIQYRGKVGNLVGYKVTNAAKEGTLGLRTYVSEIANPRTLAQATQRMRVKPAVNFYRGLADILDHSWQGVKYGARSRSKFMQLALTPSAYLIPYVNKGETRFIPGGYPVALGSISAPVNECDFSEAAYEQDSFVLFPQFYFWERDNSMTWGEWSSHTLDYVPSLRDGDEITLIQVCDAGGFYVVQHAYVVIDTASLLPYYEYCGKAGMLLSAGAVRIVRAVQPDNGPATVVNAAAGNIVAAALIISRHPARNSTTWQRTTSIMQLSDDFKAQWMSDARFEEARATYRDKTVDLSSDWLLNQADNATSGTSSLLPTTRYAVTNKAMTYSGTTAQMAILSVDGGVPKPLICHRSNRWVYGLVSGQTVTFSADYILENVPSAGTYYTDEELKAATSQYWVTYVGF